MTWLKDWERIDGNSSGDFTDVKHRKLVIHRTEGMTVAGAVGAYRKNNSWPHATADPYSKRRVQHVSLDKASRATRNESGGIETNRDGVINLEIVGFSANSGLLTEPYLKWLGEEVFRPIMIVRAIPTIITPRKLAKNSTEGYGLKTQFRMKPEEWDFFTGLCGHCNVPENTHWDPGAMNLLRILMYAFPAPIMEVLVGRLQDANSAFDFIDRSFKKVLRREPEEDALHGYFNQLMAVPPVDPVDFLNGLVNSPENLAGDD